MIKTRKQMFIAIFSFVLIMLLGTVTYAFFNYMRTGSSNTIKVGRISFNTSQTGTINLNNVFPIERSSASSDNNNSSEVVITITGDTTYEDGVEYLVTVKDVNIETQTHKKIPIGIIVTPEKDNTELGVANANYFNNGVRGGNTSYYKVLKDGATGDIIKEGDYILVGYIRPGESEVNGKVGIRAFIDQDMIAVSDTYDGSESDEMGTTSSWVNGRTVLTTNEWNSLQGNNSISFKVSVEANEGIWVGEPLSRNDMMKFNGTTTNYFTNEQKAAITEINFIRMSEEMINTHANLMDFTASGGQGVVKAWIEDGKLYIASPGETYFPVSSSGLFSEFSNVVTIHFGNVNTTLARHMSSMFYGCSSLLYLDLSSFDISNLDCCLSAMFRNCTNLVYVDLSSFDTSYVEEMQLMFSGCVSLTSLDLSNFDTGNVLYMQDMFAGCTGLTNLNISNFDTSKVVNMYEMFAGCDHLTKLNVSSFDTSEVENMEGMFSGCASLTSLDVSSFDTSKVENMSAMFASCTSLTSLDLSNFDTREVETMNSMFWRSNNLVSVNLSSFQLDSAPDLSGMFAECSSLISLDLSSFNTGTVTSMGGMFYGASALTTIEVGSNWNVNNVSASGGMFASCSSLVGGQGTTYDANYTDKTYAKVDGGVSSPGYLTLKTV